MAITKKLRARVISLAASGMGRRHITKKLGISYETLLEILPKVQVRSELKKEDLPSVPGFCPTCGVSCLLPCLTCKLAEMKKYPILAKPKREQAKPLDRVLQEFLAVVRREGTVWHEDLVPRERQAAAQLLELGLLEPVGLVGDQGFRIPRTYPK